MSTIRANAILDGAGGSTATVNGTTIPASSTLVTTTGAQTLTNKSIDASQLTGNVAAARITSALNASGSAPIFACRAWVNFDGTGVVSIRASGNVSSITDWGVGSYTVNFTTAMQDALYVANITHYSPNTTTYPYTPVFNGQNTSGFAFQTIAASVGVADFANIHCAFFR